MTGLGLALQAQNIKTIDALAAGKHLARTGTKRGVDKGYPFATDPRTAARFARMGDAIAGDDGRPALVWPDMAKVEEQAKANRPPMPEEVKEKLRERAKANPKDKGDEVALMLRPCVTLDDVYKAAAEYLGEKVDEMKAKYAKLNPGQQRMICGNRMRAKWKALNLKAGAPGREKS